MGNLGGAEIVVIFLVALIVLGPDKLPGAAKQVGRVFQQIKSVSAGFQREMQNAMNDPLNAGQSTSETKRTEVAEKLRDAQADSTTPETPPAAAPNNADGPETAPDAS